MQRQRTNNMTSPPKTLCAKCFKSAKTNFISCHICKAKYHFLCVKINSEKFGGIFSENINIVFNCDDCLNATADMMSLLSSLSQELREIKETLFSQLSGDVKEMKQKFDDLSKDLEKVCKEPKIHASSAVVADNIQSANADRCFSFHNVVGGHLSLDKQPTQQHQTCDASSTISYPTAQSEVRSNMCDNDWTNVRRRKRRNRVIAVGENETTDLGVVVKKKYIHISSFQTSVTPEHIIAYIEKNVEIGKHHIECTLLVKKDVDVKTLKHVNFKVGVSPCFYSQLTKPSLWPTNINVRPFIFFEKKPAALPNA